MKLQLFAEGEVEAALAAGEAKANAEQAQAAAAEAQQTAEDTKEILKWTQQDVNGLYSRLSDLEGRIVAAEDRLQLHEEENREREARTAAIETFLVEEIEEAPEPKKETKAEGEEPKPLPTRPTPQRGGHWSHGR